MNSASPYDLDASARTTALSTGETYIYLAGPDVFLPDAAAVGERKKQICAEHGLVGLFPLDNDLLETDSSIPLSLQIYRANLALMQRADAVIANLTPFRGPGADGGTVFELGYMVGQGKPVFGYSNVNTLYLAKTINIYGRRKRSDDFIDPSNMLIENFGLHDNLMIEHGSEMFGSPFEVPPAGTFSDDPWRDMRQFERCVRSAADILAKRRQ